MSWVAVGVAAVGVVSSVSAQNSADKASKRADKANKRAMQFEQQKYDDWKDTYGPIESNLASYYTSLTPEYYATQGLEAFKKEQDFALTRIKENLAQRGLSDSGIKAAVEKDSAFESAKGRAKIRAEAPLKVAQEKFNFLQAGLGLNPGDSMSALLQNNAANAARSATAAGTSAANATSNAITTMGPAINGLIDYFGSNTAGGGGGSAGGGGGSK